MMYWNVTRNRIVTRNRQGDGGARFFFGSLVLFLFLLLPAPLIHAASTWTQTTNVDFNGGTRNNVVVTGTGAGGAVILDSAYYLFRRSITIDNSGGGALTDYQVKITLDSTSFDFSKTRPDGDDIRFLDSDDGTLLHYWTESWDNVAQKAMVWVKIPSIPAASTKTILMYYGSPGAGSGSDGTATFDLFDDFDNLNAWTASGSGIIVSGGTVTLSDSAWTNPSISRTFDISSPFTAEMKYQHPSKFRNRLYLQTLSSGPPTSPGDDYGIYDSSIYWHGEWTGINLNLNTWYIIRWENTPTDYIWRILNLDNTEVLNRLNGSAIPGLERLTFSATDHPNSVFTLDWVRIRKYTTSEPTVSVGAETDGNDKLVYSSSGSFVSSAFDTGEFSSFQILSWDGEVPIGTTLKFQIRTANTEAELNSASWYGPTGVSDFYTASGLTINPIHNAKRWVQYKVYFETLQASITPTLKSVSIDYALADVTISSNTSWPEGTYQIVNLTVNNGATLSIAGGSTVNVSGTITVSANSTILFQGKNTTDQVGGLWAGVGVTIHAGNVQVDNGSMISADGQGYETSKGPGAGLSASDGGSYGGRGANNSGPTYGSSLTPLDLGSGGGANSPGWSRGGGAIRLEVTDTLTLNGQITANGTQWVDWWGTAASGGSGGSIYLTTGALTGSGKFTANGGPRPTYGSDGGGGRIAVYFGADVGFTGFTSSTALAGGAAAANGTVVFFNTTENHLRVAGQSFVLNEDTTASYNAVTVESGGTLVIGGGSVIDVSGTLTVIGNSTILLQGKNTTGKVNGQWAGVGVTLRAANMVVAAGSKISADGQGYETSQGPGAGPTQNDGGSYGGRGGWNSGTTYGSATAPTDLGSGGGSDTGDWSHGGGAIRLDVSETLTLDGEVTANGMIATSWWGSNVSGGAGGSIYVTAGTLTGSGTFAANGASGPYYGVGGGGGRIAVYYRDGSSFTGFASSTASAGPARDGYPVAQDGTAAFFDTSVPGKLMSVFQRFVFDEDAAVHYGGISLSDSALLEVGGGSRITLDQDLSVTDHSTVLLHGKNVSGLVNGRWAGAGAKIHAANMMVDGTSKISADGEGYMTRQGPGAGPGGNDGGSYGGRGAYNSGPTYGSASFPIDLGSGGDGDGSGGSGDGWSRGGGAIRLDVSDTLTVDGEITADGVYFSSGWTVRASGGSGGSVFVSAKNVTGSGTIAAKGGRYNYYGSFGGGGRIAIHYWGEMSLPTANITAAAGGPPAGDGTIVMNHEPLYRWADSSGSLFHDTKRLAWEAVAVNPDGMAVEILASSGGSSSSLAAGLSAMGEWGWNTRGFSDGLYELRAVFRNASSEITGEITKNVLVNNSVIWHSGRISASETWVANRVHVVEDHVVISSGVCVTVEPGAIVKFAEGTKIIIEDGGSLVALATPDRPILFTSLTDDTVGGDTNLDGTATRPQPGYWDGFVTQGTGTVNKTYFVSILYIKAAHAGSLAADERWLGTYRHWVTNDVTIPNGVTLTIEPGAAVKFDAFKGIVVQSGGRLVAEGTVALPIYFTSIKDDSVGGDTNGDGNSTTPAAGDWRWIHVDGGQASIDHAILSYGGGTSSGSGDDTGMIRTSGSSSLTVSNSIIRESFYEGVLIFGGGVTIKNSVVTGTQRAINAMSGTVVNIVNCTIDDNNIGALYHGGTINLSNTLVTNSLTAGIAYCCGGPSPSIRYSNVWSSSGVNYGSTPDLTGTNGNVTVDPLYRNREQGNYRLDFRSPCIDAADGTVAPATDFMGAPRYTDPRTSPKKGIPNGSGVYADIGAFEFVETADADVDLVVNWVRGPAEILAGEEVFVEWQITNIGTGLAVGPWHDQISLAADIPTRGVAELIAGESLSHATLGTGDSAVFSAKVRIPGGTEGTWHWQVRANWRGEVFEGKNWTNNISPLGSAVRLSLPGLVAGVPGEGAFAGVGAPDYWKIAQGAGQQLLISVDSAASTGRVRIYVGNGSAPTKTDFDLRSLDTETPDPRLAIPAPGEARTVYVMVDPESLPGTDLGYSIIATVAGFDLTAIGLTRGGNAGEVTIPLIGSGFGASLEASLRPSSGAEINAGSVLVRDSGYALARFDLSGALPGTYDVIARQGSAVKTLAHAFTVVEGVGSKLGTKVILPEHVRVGRPFKGIVEVANTGDADMPVPLMILQGTTDHPVWAVGEPQSYAREILQFLPIASDELSGGVFRPGQSYAMTFFSMTSTAGTISYQVFYEPGDSSESVDWTAFKAEVRPAVPPAHWDEAWTALVGRIGTTYGDYITALVSAHDEATSCGLDLQNLRSLIGYMITKEITLLSGADVSGKVYLGDTNHPLKMAAVTLVDEDLNNAFSTKSLCDGSFALRDVLSGKYALSIRDYIPNPWDEVTVATGSPVTNLEVVVTPGSQLAGRIVDSEDGQPIAGAIVSATDDEGAFYDTQSGSDGRYILSGLPSGMLYVDVLAERFISPLTQQVTLETGQTTPLSFALSPGGTITGRITASGGSPVSGATVEAIPTTGTESREAVSGSDGTYEIPGLVAGTYKVVASATGYGSAVREDVVAWEKAVTSGVDIILASSGQITGAVTDTSTAKAIEGVSVTIETPGVNDELSRTDKDGKFALTGVPPGSHKLHFTADGYVDEAVTVDIGVGENKNLTVALRLLGSVSGYVKDGAGNAIPGVLVVLVTPLGIELTVSTSSDGFFSFTGLPDGEYRIYITGLDGLYIEGQSFALGATQNVFTITTTLHAAELDGRVLRSGGEGAGQTGIFLVREGQIVGRTSTDDQGRYSFVVFQEGALDVIAMGTSVGIQRSEGVNIPSGSHVSAPDITGGDASLSVSVSSSALGQPAVKDAMVVVRPSWSGSPDVGLTRFTEESGTALIGSLTPDGAEYVVEVSASGAAPARKMILLTDPNGAISFDLEKGRTIHGSILNEERQPVQGAQISFIDRAGGEAFVALADEEGAYSISSLPRSTFDLWVTSEAHRPLLIPDVSTVDQETRIFDVTLRPLGATLKGIVKGADGEPVIGARVNVINGAGVPLKSTSSGQDGSYSIGMLPGGLNRIRVEAPGIPDTLQEVDLPENGERIADLTVEAVYAMAKEPEAGRVLKEAARDASVDYRSIVKDAWAALWNEPQREGYDTDSWRDQWMHVDSCKMEKCSEVSNAYLACADSGRKLDQAFHDWWNAWSNMKGQAFVESGLAVSQAALLYFKTIMFIEGAASRLDKIVSIANQVQGVSGEVISIVQSLISLGGNINTDILTGNFDQVGARLDTVGILLSTLQRHVANGNVYSQLGLVGNALGVISLANDYKNAISDFMTTMPNNFKVYAEIYKNMQRDYHYRLRQHRANLLKLQSALASCNPCCKPPCCDHPPCCEKPPCDPPPPPDPPPGGGGGTQGSNSSDPNAKITVGFGIQGFISGETPIIYTIDFENKATATAPAQQVVVTDQLSSNLDWSTVELVSIGFNKVDLSIPSSLNQYEAKASVATDPNPVLVQAGLDPDTGLMTWSMESVDQVTGGLPEDPIAGFLPPNTDGCGHCGEGYVVFSVMPKKGLSPGTLITNQARIVFDVNPPIDTNTVTNTILLVEPEEGTLGTTITLAGANFGSKKGKVLIGGMALKVTSWTPGTIDGVLSKVPAPGAQSIVVQPKDPKGATALGLGTFEVKTPEIVRLDKNHGAAGTVVTLTGNFLGTKKGKILLGTGEKPKSCKVVSWKMEPTNGHSEVVFVVPKGLAKGAKDLTISNSVGSVKMTGGFTIDTP